MKLVQVKLIPVLSIDSFPCYSIQRHYPIIESHRPETPNQFPIHSLMDNNACLFFSRSVVIPLQSRNSSIPVHVRLGETSPPEAIQPLAEGGPAQRIQLMTRAPYYWCVSEQMQGTDDHDLTMEMPFPFYWAECGVLHLSDTLEDRRLIDAPQRLELAWEHELGQNQCLIAIERPHQTLIYNFSHGDSMSGGYGFPIARLNPDQLVADDDISVQMAPEQFLFTIARKVLATSHPGSTLGKFLNVLSAIRTVEQLHLQHPFFQDIAQHGVEGWQQAYIQAARKLIEDRQSYLYLLLRPDGAVFATDGMKRTTINLSGLPEDLVSFIHQHAIKQST